MPVFTRKFSQFVSGAVTDVVGLTAGANTIGSNGGGGGGGSVTKTITQTNSFSLGQVVRFDPGTNLYQLALATTPLLAEAYGIVVGVSPPGLPPYSSFTLQQAGFIDPASGVFAPGTFIPGEPQYLSDTVSGLMVPTDVLIDGEVSKPVFLPDSDSGGLVAVLMRGLIAGGGPDTGGGGGGGTTEDTSRVTVIQNGHGFNPGDWLRIETPTAGPNQVHYVKADASTFDRSQSVGVVVSLPTGNPVNSFVIQFTSYVITDPANNIIAPFQDEALAALIPKRLYYLSATPNSGQLVSVDPSLANPAVFSKPLYIPEQTPGTVNANAGYILPQRPLTGFTASPFASPYIFLGNLDSTNNWSNPNIFFANGGPFGSYFMTFNPNVINGHGLSAVGPNPITIGFQFASGGVFYTGTDYQATLGGVSNRTGLNVGTVWAFVDDTSSPTAGAIIFPNLPGETGRRVAISQGSWTLIDNGFGTSMSVVGTCYCTDWSVGNVPSNHNFTSTGQSAGSNGGVPGSFTSGIRLHFDGVGAAIFDGTEGYFTIWGIPNS